MTQEPEIPAFDAEHFSGLQPPDLARLIGMSANRLQRFVSAGTPDFLLDKELDLLSRRVNGYLLKRKRERGEA